MNQSASSYKAELTKDDMSLVAACLVRSIRIANEKLPESFNKRRMIHDLQKLCDRLSGTMPEIGSNDVTTICASITSMLKDLKLDRHIPSEQRRAVFRQAEMVQQKLLRGVAG